MQDGEDSMKISAAHLALCALVAAGSAKAENIVVSNYGVSANGMPFAETP